MSWIVIVKNNSGAAQWIEDFGILLQNGTQVILTDTADYDEIGGSVQLKEQVTVGNLIINDGTSDLSIPDALNFITLENINSTLDTFYTQDQLASGGGLVHWDNITNAPAFGSPYWIEPVEVIALDVASVPLTGTAVDGDFIVDTDDDTIYQLVAGTWTPFLVGTEGTRVINLNDTNQSVWELSGGTWTDTESPTGSMAVLVTDDGDGKQAQYVYNDDTLSWVKIADVDWDTGQIELDLIALSGAIDVNSGDILNLQTDVTYLSGAIDNNSTDITALSGAIDINTGDILNLQLDTVFLSGAIDNNSTDITELSAAIDHNYTEHVALSAQIDINTDNIYTLSAAISGVGADHNTLDEAYNQGGAGAGRSIITNSGSMILSAGGSGYAPLELTPTPVMPTTGLQDGQVTMNGGILYVYDATRGKWLSVQRQFIAFGKEGKARDQYIDFYVGELSSNKSGLRLARNATIVSLAGQLDEINTCTFSIRKNDLTLSVTQLTLSNVIGDQDTTINLVTDLSQGDFLQCYFDSSGQKVKSPVIIVELAWMV